MNSPRVAGIGVGLFVLFLVGILSIIGCVVGWKFRKLRLSCCSGGGLWIALLLFLVFSPKESENILVSTETDYTIIPRTIAGIFLFLGFMLGLSGFTKEFMNQIYKPNV